MADDLASGFQSVDAASDFEVFAGCLTLIDSLPFFAECKRASYDLLAATPGSRILEVGCGLGDDAAALAKRVAPGGSVVAVDGSQAMVEAAQQRHGDIAGLSFDVADASRLPYSDATFRRLPYRPRSSAHRRPRGGDFARWSGSFGPVGSWSRSTTTGRR
jgi:ubiquinone/menaquinone biosynthesis C-methylase UbiE